MGSQRAGHDGSDLSTGQEKRKAVKDDSALSGSICGQKMDGISGKWWEEVELQIQILSHFYSSNVSILCFFAF